MKISDIGEFKLIQHIATYLSKDLPDGIVGIGDDCAMIARSLQSIEKTELLTTDQLVENVHFIRSKNAAEDLGYKSLAVNLSDIAAKGGVPLYALLSLSLPVDLELEWINQFMTGLNELAKQENVLVIGGDTTRSPGPIFINLTLVGECPTRQIKRRSDARFGDVICCTGCVGNSGAGLKVLLENLSVDETSIPLIKAHLRPQPQLKKGRWLSQQPGVHAMMDLSDGIYCDIQRIMDVSNCGACIDLGLLPLSSNFKDACKKYGWTMEELAVTSGEDYQLLLTIDPNSYASINEAYY